MFTIFCFINETKAPFSVKVPKDATVDELKQEIQKTVHAEAAGISKSLIDLYQIDIPSDKDRDQKIRERLKALGQPLDETYPIEEYYTSAPPRPKTVHILVVPSEALQELGE